MRSSVWDDRRPVPPGPVYAGRAAGGASGSARRGGRALALLGPVLVAALLLAGPAEAQRSSGGGAFIQVPAVAQLEVEPVAASGGETGAGSGMVRIRVRANHAWKLLVTAAPGGGAVEVRTTGPAGGATHRLRPGSETVVATGGRGSVVIEVEYRGDPGSEPGLPLTYTLASS